MVGVDGSPTIAIDAVSLSRPPARSFQPRRRALPPARAERYARLAGRWSLAVEGEPLSFGALFGPVDVVLDIGFGGGEGLIELAVARPDQAVIGVDVHTPGVANVLEAIEAHGWHHVRVVAGDVLELLARVPNESLAGIRLYFPDPWPKNKQRHRRLVRPDVVASFVDRLAIGGSFHVATDAADYAAQVVAVCGDERRLCGGIVERPTWRPLTRFEQRGISAGRSCTDLLYERTA
jgi:tRNA (guanine-N7-)-methyltransferase